MTPADHLTGQQARRRARRYRFRVWFRLVIRGAIIPGWVIGVAAALAIAAFGLRPLTVGLIVQTITDACLFLALWRWWQAERAVAIARQLQLDTRQGPLGMKGSTR